MSDVANKEYRLTPEEASNLDAGSIMGEVRDRISEDLPDTGDSDAMDRFYERILPVQASVYAAEECATWVVVGGLGHFFEMCCSPTIYRAVGGLELLGQPQLAHTLRKVCEKFPGGSVPRDREQADAFLSSAYHHDGELKALFQEFEDRPTQKWFDHVESFFKSHRDSFVVPEANSSQQGD